MIVSVCGMSMAAPRPWTARNPISQPGLGDRPHAAEATVNRAMPEANRSAARIGHRAGPP